MNAADPRDARIAVLERLLSAALARIAQQDVRIAEQEARIAELEAWLRSTSRNSSHEARVPMQGSGADHPVRAMKAV